MSEQAFRCPRTIKGRSGRFCAHTRPTDWRCAGPATILSLTWAGLRRSSPERCSSMPTRCADGTGHSALAAWPRSPRSVSGVRGASSRPVPDPAIRATDQTSADVHPRHLGPGGRRTNQHQDAYAELGRRQQNGGRQFPRRTHNEHCLIGARQKTPGFLTRRGTGVGVCPDQSGARNAISVIFAKVRPVMRRSPALHAKFSRPRRCGVAFSTMSEVVGRVRRPCGAASAEGRPDAAPAAAGADRSGAGSPPGWTAQPSARSRPPPCSALGQGPAARDC